MRATRLTRIVSLLLLAACAGDTTTPSITPTVVAVNVSLSASTVQAGKSVQATAMLRDQLGNTASVRGDTVIWASSNSDVATIAPSTGVVTALSPGITTISATALGKTGSALLTVTTDPVEGTTAVATVEVTLPSPTIALAQSAQANVVLRDASKKVLTGRTIGWSSANPAIAAVSSSGVVTGTGLGTTVITATSEGKIGETTVTVVPPAPAPVAFVNLDIAPAAIVVGGSAQATATLRDIEGGILADRPVTWSTSDPEIATVSQTGGITGVGVGTATITATSEGKSASAPIAVTPAPVASVSVEVPSDLKAGQTTAATAKTYDARGNLLTGRTCTWSSTNPTILTVSNDGMVSGISGGIASVVATCEGKTGSAGVRVIPANQSSAASILVSFDQSTIAAGASTQAHAVVRDQSGNQIVGAAVTWSSSNPSIATVSSSGVVTGVNPGSASIVATIGSVTGSAAVAVGAPQPVASVAVQLASSQIEANGTTQATVMLRDANGSALTGRPVTWSSSNPFIAKVNASGVVSAIRAGTATIRATSEGKTGSATLTVTGAPVAAVSVTIDDNTLRVGQTAQASAVTRDASNNVLTGRVVTWSSSNSNVASVNPSTGVVTGVAPGSASIIATSEGRTGQVGVTVSIAQVSSVSVSLGANTLVAGGSTQATATLRDAFGTILTGRTVTWSSSNTLVATVNSSTGVVTAKAAGTANIIATSEGKTGAASLTVSAVPVANVTVAVADNSLDVGQTTTAAATTRDASGNVLTGRPVVWSSSNPAVATVSASGAVTAVGAGNATIMASSEGRTGQASVTVSAPAVASVSVAFSRNNISVGSTAQATATLRDANNNVLTGRTVTWSSSNTSVATVSASGVVTAVGGGTASIRATSEGKTGSSTITVVAPVSTVSVSISSSSVPVAAWTQATATLRDANGAIVTGRTVTWSSSNTSVATVSSAGIVTGVSTGSATITASVDGTSGSATVTVTGSASSVTVLFRDGFESNNFNTKQNNIRWTSMPDVSITTAIAHSGSRAAVVNQANGWGEMRFDGLPNLDEVYIQFWMYMPSGTESPSLGPKLAPRGSLNDKFFRLWGNSDADYAIDGTGNGNKVGASTYGVGGDKGTLAIEYAYTTGSSQWPMGRGNPPTEEVSFINDANRGRWIRIGIRAKHATSANNDGIVQIFVDGKLLTGYTNLRNYPTGANARRSFTTGYLLGALNNGGIPGQKVYIDDVTFSTGGFPP